MSATEHDEHDAADDDGVTLPADEPGVTDEPGPSDEEQAAEADDEELTPEPEPEPESRGLSERDWEERFKKSEQRFATYARAIGTIFEEEANDLIPCPLCLGPVRGFVDKAQAGRVPEEQAELVKHFLGLSRPIALRPDPETQTCATCDGEGKTATGSKVPGQHERPCPKCKGYGYTPPPGLPQNGHVGEGLAPPPLSVGSPDIQTGDVDDWKEPRILPDGRENPNFGKMPQFKVKVAPWGQTAGLTAQDAVPAGGS